MAKKTSKGRKNKAVDCCLYRTKNIILPLLATLADLKLDQQTFVLAHLDEKTLRTLCSAVDKVLHAKLPDLLKRNLRRDLSAHKDCLRRLCQHQNLSCESVRKGLMRMGGGPLKLVLRSAIPLYSK